MKHHGVHRRRLRLNPREAAFSTEWDDENDRSQRRDLLWTLLGDGSGKAFPNQRDAEVAATVIQWLGSNVGMSFLLEVIRKNPAVREFLNRQLKP